MGFTLEKLGKKQDPKGRIKTGQAFFWHTTIYP